MSLSTREQVIESSIDHAVKYLQMILSSYNKSCILAVMHDKNKYVEYSMGDEEDIRKMLGAIRLKENIDGMYEKI